MTYAPGETVATANNFAPSALAGGARPVVPAGTKFATRPAGITLGPGQSLHFTPGQGYWAGPAPAAPPPSPGPASGFVMTPQQMATDAGNQATQQVQGQVAPLNTQVQQNTALGGAQDYQAGQFATAASKILGGIGPAVQQGYDTAAKDISSFAKAAGLGGLSPTLADEQAGQQQFLSQVGQGGAQFNSAKALGNDLGLRQGFIPSNQLAQDAAAANTWAQGLKAVGVANAGARIQANDATTQANQAKIQSKIDAVAAKYPEYFNTAYKSDIATSLRALGIDAKSAQAAASLAEKYWNDNITATHDQNMDTHAQNQDIHAQTMAKIAWGHLALGRKQLNAKIQYDNGMLQIRGTSAQASLIRAQIAEHGIDLSATKAYGVIMQKNGQPLRVKGPDGKLHTVAPDPRIYSSKGPLGGFSQTPKGRYQAAVDRAGTDLAHPQPAPSGVGASFVLDTGLVGNTSLGDIQDPFTHAWYTNASSRAAKGIRTFQEEVTFLQNGHSLTRSRARAAAISAGWKPGKSKSSAPLAKAVGSPGPFGPTP